MRSASLKWLVRDLPQITRIPPRTFKTRLYLPINCLCRQLRNIEIEDRVENDVDLERNELLTHQCVVVPLSIY